MSRRITYVMYFGIGISFIVLVMLFLFSGGKMGKSAVWLSGIFLSLFFMSGVGLVVYEFVFPKYVLIKTNSGDIVYLLSSIEEFIGGILRDIKGIGYYFVNVSANYKGEMGIDIAVRIIEKGDFLRMTERIQSRVKQDLEFNFGINGINYVNVVVESVVLRKNDKEEPVIVKYAKS